MKLRNSLGLVVIFGFGGCAPAPKPVRLDLDLFDTGVVAQSVQLSANRVSVRQDLRATLPGRASRLLEEREGLALWEKAKLTLAENRAKSLERLRADLERKYLGESRAEAIAKEREARIRNDEDWAATLERVRLLMEQYAGEKTELSADLAGIIGFPDRGQKVQKRSGADVYFELREKKVADLRKRLSEIEDVFQKEVGVVLAEYRSRVVGRAAELADLDLAGDLAAIGRAEAEANAAIRAVIGQVDATIPQLLKRLDALPSESIAGKRPEEVSPMREQVQWEEGLSREDLEKYAMVFLKSRGYERTERANAVDVTEEFGEWLNRTLATR